VHGHIARGRDPVGREGHRVGRPFKAENGSGGADQPRRHHGDVPGPTADIEHVHAGRDARSAEQFFGFRLDERGLPSKAL